MGSRIFGAIENPIKLLYVSKITTISKASFKNLKLRNRDPLAISSEIVILRKDGNGRIVTIESYVYGGCCTCWCGDHRRGCRRLLRHWKHQRGIKHPFF